jgi:hypothetical protein
MYNWISVKEKYHNIVVIVTLHIFINFHIIAFKLWDPSLRVHSTISPIRPVRLAYQPTASSTFLSEQTSHQQPASRTFLLEQISTSHQPPAKRTGWVPRSFSVQIFAWFFWSVHVANNSGPLLVRLIHFSSITSSPFVNWIKHLLTNFHYLSVTMSPNSTKPNTFWQLWAIHPSHSHHFSLK